MSEELFDRQLYIMRQRRFADAMSQANFIHLEVENSIIELLSSITKPFGNAMLYGAFYQIDPLMHRIEHAEYFDLIPRAKTQYLDEEELPTETTPKYDLIISQLSLHTINDLPGVLIRYRKMLKPGGLFIATLYGDETLHELRDCMMLTDMELLDGIAPRVIPFIDVKTAGMLVQRAGFSMPVAVTERHSIGYGTLSKLLDDIRVNGQANCMHARDRGVLSLHYLQRLEEIYRLRYSIGDSLRCTYDIITINGSVG